MISGTAIATYEEVAQRLHMTPALVRMTERRALRKLRRDPILRSLAAEYGVQTQPNMQTQPKQEMTSSWPYN